MKTDDPKLLEIKNKVLSASQRKEQAAWEAVLASEAGRRVLWGLMKEFGLYNYCIPSNGNGTKLTENAARQGCAQFIKNQVSFWAGGEVWAVMEKEEMLRVSMDRDEVNREQDKLQKQREDQK